MVDGQQDQVSCLLSPNTTAPSINSDEKGEAPTALAYVHNHGLANLRGSSIDLVSSIRAGKTQAQKRKRRFRPCKPHNELIKVIDSLAQGMSRPPIPETGTSARLPAIRRGKPRKESSALSVALRPKPCRVCEKNHPEVCHKCPHLQSIQQGRALLPRSCCPKCLGPTSAAGKCTKGSKCHLIVAKKGAQYDLLCHVHGQTHFRICVHCPPSKTAVTVKDQQISMLRFCATTVSNPSKFRRESEDREDANVFLRLDRLTSEEILLDHTTQRYGTLPLSLTPPR